MNNSKIEWTEDTGNILRVKDSLTFYCAKVSKGCENCYSEVMSRRLAAIGGTTFYPFMNMKKPPELELNRKMISNWATKKRPRKIFVSSMTDVFGEFVPKEWIFEMLDGMIAAPIQTFQVLTKRAKRMKELVNEYCDVKGIKTLPENIWLMVSVENQECANERIPELLEAKCKIRGLSCEPLLGSINLEEIELPSEYNIGNTPMTINCLTTMDDRRYYNHHNIINWVVCGGESGHGARPMHPIWARHIKNHCKQNGTAFFFKQWGCWMPIDEPHEQAGDIKPLAKNERWMNYDGGHGFHGTWVWRMRKVNKKEAGNLLDGEQYMEFPNID